MTNQDYFSINMKKSEAARSELARGILTAQNPFKLLLIAIECIKELTNDTAFLVSCRNNIEAVYGVGTKELEYLSYSEQVRKLEAVQASERLCDNTDVRERLQLSERLQENIIKKHKNR